MILNFDFFESEQVRLNAIILQKKWANLRLIRAVVASA